MLLLSMPPDHSISSLFANATRPLLSLEFFPPKQEQSLDPLRATATQLRAVQPDFVTCTYGAGGSTRARTMEVCSLLRDLELGPVMPHLTCVGSSRDELREIADDIHARGFRNIMTLRGDPPQGQTAFEARPDGLAHASELVQLLKARHPDFCCGVAGYPEVHPEAESADSDLLHLGEKIQAGGDFVTTQLFFNNEVYFRFVARCRAAEIDAPILPGLLPAVSLPQVRRICAMCRADLPSALADQLEAAGGTGPAAARVGLEWVANQIRELLVAGAPGIHLYILNRAEAAIAPAIIDCFEHLAV